MKYFWLLIAGLFFAPGCEAQSQLPRELPEKVSITYHRTGGMSRSFRKIRIENGRLVFEELRGTQEKPQKWMARIKREDLSALYLTFVEHRFDAIKNDERKGIVYDAGSENIAVSAGAGRYFQVTSGKNSPLSGKNLERYNAVRKAIEDFVARYESAKTGNWFSREEAEKMIQGKWRAAGENGGRSWFLEWTFADGNFRQTGYPPIIQEGKYRLTEIDGDHFTLELDEQQGTFGTKKRTVTIIFEEETETMTIGGTRGFSRREK